MNKLSSIPYNYLAEQIEGDLSTDELHRYLLSTDGSIYQKHPSCVVFPRNREDVIATLKFASEHQIPIHPRGTGSGLCGSALGEGIVLDFTRYMNRLLELNATAREFECEPGYRLGELEQALKGCGLFFPPDPSSGEYASFGGMYGTNASGAHSVKYGNVADYILDAEVILADGTVCQLSQISQTPIDQLPGNLAQISEIYSKNQETIESAYPEIRCNVAGYNLRELLQNDQLYLQKLFAGSEGTLGVVTKLRFRLLDKPSHDSLVVAFFDDIINSAKAAQAAMELHPSGIEIMDKSLLTLARENDPMLKDKIPGDVDNLLLIEFDGFDPAETSDQANHAKQVLEDAGLTRQAHLAATEEEKARFWAIRKAAVPILYKLKGKKKILALIEDAAIPIEGLVEYFEGIYKILNQHNLQFVVYGHIAKGLMHTRPLLDLKDPQDIALLPVLADEVYKLVTGLNGTVSGEHGDGRLRSAYVKRRYPEIFPFFQQVKDSLDPKHLLNPEIITNPDPKLISSNLRFGENYQSTEAESTELIWQEGFLNQIETCHGCSKCTTVTTATRMCPIYKVTREETATPKAKANALRAISSKAVDQQTYLGELFQTTINACVNCGSCYQECPSNVNIPKLALEAKAQLVLHKGASLFDRLVTGIETAARNTWRFSERTYPIQNHSIVKKGLEKLFGLSSQREISAFSSRPLRKRLKEITGNHIPSVLYFAGCYASYIRPEIGEAAVKVLNACGYSVHTPEQHCCGLPALSKGMVSLARKKIDQNLKQWGDLLDKVDHVVITCSSCGLSLLQEWSYLVDNTISEKIKNKTIHISELLLNSGIKPDFKQTSQSLAYHLPCHLKVQPSSQSSLKLLGSIPGITITDLATNCCGMAGSWGMSKENFELSKSIAMPLIDSLNNSDASIGVTDCPTCRMQMEQFSQKPIRHPIEIVANCIS